LYKVRRSANTKGTQGNKMWKEWKLCLQDGREVCTRRWSFLSGSWANYDPERA